MYREMLKSKIQKAIITNTVLHYNGSIGIDKAILKECNILPGEKVHVLNYNTGDRFQTYVIEELLGSGNVVLYGPAAKKGSIKDEICILSYCLVSEDEMDKYSSRVIYLDESNKVKEK